MNVLDCTTYKRAETCGNKQKLGEIMKKRNNCNDWNKIEMTTYGCKKNPEIF